VADVVDEDAGGAFAGAEAFGEFDSELSIRRSVSGVDTVAVADGFEEFFAAAECTGDAAAEPDAVSSERIVFFLEEVVEGHGVVNFGRVEFQEFSDFDDGFFGDSAEGVVDEVKSRQSDGALVGVFGKFRLDFLAKFSSEDAHVRQPEG
jgi:hypothetical protein